ncbi:MAG TPA: GNAT family N-acetyltransferase [Ktedonobacterales bacterium]
MALEELTRLARAVEDNWCAAWASLGIVRHELPTYVDAPPAFVRVRTPGAPDMLLNIVLRYHGRAPVQREDLEAIVAPYMTQGLPFQWWLLRGDEPEDLRERLRRLALTSCGGSVCMALSLTGWNPSRALPPAALPPDPAATAGPVTSRADAKAAHQVICEVFAVPSDPMARWTTANPAFQLYLARWAGQPVSALAVLRDRTTAGIYHVATRPGYRRRGLAGHLLALALRDARAAGADLATLTATPEARPLYESLGFRACGWIEQWIPGPDLMNDLHDSGHGRRGYASATGGW